MVKKIERTISYVAPFWKLDQIQNVWVIGCGGNGSHLVADLARLLTTLDRKVSLFLIDGDNVEKKNLIRQHFTKTDIGKNKAEVLAKRYGAAYGMDIGYIPEYLTKDNCDKLIGANNSLIVTCTDNLFSRHLVSKKYGSIWVDLGNEEHGGQVTFSSLLPRPMYSNYVVDKSDIPTPTVFELFPNMEETVKNEVPIEQRSCAEMAEESPNQAGFVNVMCAAIAKNYIHAFFAGRPIKTYQTFFTIDNTFEHRTMTESVFRGWMQNIPRFQNFYL